MALLINKDGKQLGPYSLEEARKLVLGGHIAPTDWAWPDNATDWVLLKDVPGFSVAAPTPVTATADMPVTMAAPVSATKTAAAATPAAATTSTPAPEEELWSGHPSQVLNLSIYVFWGVIVLLTLAALLFVDVFSESAFWGSIIAGTVAAVGLINAAVAYIHLHAIEYVVTNQRVRIISGIFSKDIQEIELFRVKDTMANQSFLLRLFGLGTITILSGDEGHPRLVLSGVPDAIELRERLRQEVMTLRQRFGVREVDVM